jgi:hypothetical protein
MAKIAKKNGSLRLRSSGISSLIFIPAAALPQVLYSIFYICFAILAQECGGKFV